MEILTSFSAQYDFSLVASQCLGLTALILLLALPAAIGLVPGLATGLLARDVDPVELARTRAAAWLGPVLLGAILLATIGLPLFGLLQPLTQGIPLSRALPYIQNTFANTFIYALGAGAVAVVVGFSLALCAGRSGALRALLLAGLIAIFALPPSLFALGLLRAANFSPAALDPLLRSPLTVCLCLGLRLITGHNYHRAAACGHFCAVVGRCSCGARCAAECLSGQGAQAHGWRSPRCWPAC